MNNVYIILSDDGEIHGVYGSIRAAVADCDTLNFGLYPKYTVITKELQ